MVPFKTLKTNNSETKKVKNKAFCGYLDQFNEINFSKFQFCY